MSTLKDLLKGQVKNGGKYKFKNILKKQILRRILFLFLPILIILILIFGFLSIILPFNDGVYKEGDIRNAPYAVSTYTDIKNVTIGEDGIEIEMTAEDLWKKMIKNGSNIDKYLNSPKELEKLMNAEIITQYPKFGKGDLDGVVVFKRGDKVLKYITESKFNELIKEYNESGNNKTSDYFTIDSSGNVIMSQWTKTTTIETVTQDGQTLSSNTTVNYSMTTTSINYKSVIEKYTMPFEYLWDLLITTRGKKFVLELADFVIQDTNIEITGVEEKSTSEDEQSNSEQVEINIPVEVIDPLTGEKKIVFTTETKTKTTNVKVITESNHVKAELTEADTWIVKYTKDGGVKPKVSSNSDEKNFITLIDNHYYTMQNFIDYSRLLFELLERNDSTSNMVGLTKYLLYKLTDDKRFKIDFSFDEYEKNDFISAGSLGGTLSLTTPTLDKETFIKAMKAYAGKNSNFDANFLPYAGDIYDWSVQAGVNPELVVITAKSEGGFRQSGGAYNYWGIGVKNGSTFGTSYGSFKLGIEGYAQTILKYQTGSYASKINQLAIERQAVGVDPLGYGSPDTLSGMQSIYSDLGKHEYGSSGAGGYYYMDPARAGVTKIYATHAEFLSKCSESNLADHALNTAVTTWENGQYTAWQVEQKLKGWNDIFGAYGSLSGGNSDIIEIAKSKLGCPYVLGAKGPDFFDCSGFIYWVYQQQGITVPGTTDSYKTYTNSSYEIDWKQAQPGDILVIFNTERGTTYGHAGIYLGNDEYIHAPQSGDVVKISSGAQLKFRHIFRFY